MSALQKTKNLLRIDNFPLELMVKQEVNPNKMSTRAFDLLCDNFNKTGWTDPVLARPIDLKAFKKIAKIKDPDMQLQAIRDQQLQVKIVGGHHRYDAGAYLEFTEGPATVIMEDDFDEEAEQFQIVRMNVIHGKLDPEAFMKMYGKMSDTYSDDILQDAFGFAEESEFKKLITQIAKSMPDQNTKEKFIEAAKEIKTVDGLHKLMNELINKYGDTLPYGVMVFDHGGQRSVWLRIEGKTMKAIDVITNICIENQRTVDDVIGKVVQLIANGESKEFIDAIIAETPPVVLPKNLTVAPTKENLEALAEIA